MTNLAELVEVSVSRGDHRVLREVNLRLGEGEVVALTGPNGAGKTTLLRLLAGLETPTTGVVTRPGRGVGYLPQAVSDSIFPWFSLRKNVALPRLVQKLPDALAVAGELLEWLLPGLDPQRRAAGLSGGERQALCLARALAAPGSLVLADEPFSALSTPLRAKAIEVIRRALKGRALVLVTHDLRDAEALGARVVRLDSGAIEAAA